MKCEEERTFWERRVGEEVRFWNDRYDGAMDEVQKLRERLLESEKRLGAVERERDLLLDGNVLEKLRVDSREQSREEEADGEQQEEEQEEEEEQEQGDFDVEMMDEDAGNITQEETRATATIRIRTRPSSSPDTETAKVTATAEMEPSQKIRTREASSDSTLPGSDADQDLENHGDVKRPAEELAEEEEVEENKHQKFNL
ncbi:hypothetical protein BZA77DRAFT_322320 [Pyronema omphalodes]|nr:hypothetical protein BZA77DRAFT_322320 [Pyronema omphalodes]